MLAAALALPRAAGADEPGTDPPPRAALRRPALAIATAAVPGFFVSGAGHWVGGDPATARRLITIKGIGLGALAVSGTALFATGASRRISTLTVATGVAGAGLWFIPWLADIYGVATGGDPTGAPRLTLPRLEIDAGWAHVRDPQFAYDHFGFVEADVGVGAFRIRPSLWAAAGADNQRGRVEVAWRARGAGAREAATDGSMLEVGVAGSYHRYGDDEFGVGAVELFAGGRLEMVHIAPTLAGSFADGRAGIAWERVNYAIYGASDDYNDMLLFRFGYGLYLGDRGELSLFYDHRRDGYAQGLSPSENNGSGFLGSFGVDGFFYLTSNLGVSAGYALGAAHVARLALRVQLGGGS